MPVARILFETPCKATMGRINVSMTNPPGICVMEMTNEDVETMRVVTRIVPGRSIVLRISSGECVEMPDGG
jgi:hypothetical protein